MTISFEYDKFHIYIGEGKKIKFPYFEIPIYCPCAELG